MRVRPVPSKPIAKRGQHRIRRHLVIVEPRAIECDAVEVPGCRICGEIGETFKLTVVATAEFVEEFKTMVVEVAAQRRFVEIFEVQRRPTSSSNTEFNGPSSTWSARRMSSIDSDFKALLRRSDPRSAPISSTRSRPRASTSSAWYFAAACSLHTFEDTDDRGDQEPEVVSCRPQIS